MTFSLGKSVMARYVSRSVLRCTSALIGCAAAISASHEALACAPAISSNTFYTTTWTTIVDPTTVDYVQISAMGNGQGLNAIIYHDGTNVRITSRRCNVDSTPVNATITTATTTIGCYVESASAFNLQFRMSGSNLQMRNNGQQAHAMWHTYKACATGGSGDNLGDHTATQNLVMGGYNVTGAGGYFHSSDALLKTGIEKLSGFDILSHLTGYSYKWKDSGILSSGVLAHEVERVLPQAVYTDEKTGLKSVEYDQLIAPMIEAIKELKAENEDIKAELKELREGKE